MNKWHEICTISTLYKADIIAITETWIPSIDDANAFQYKKYNRFIACRPERKGGGVMCLIRTELHCVQIPTPLMIPSLCECVIVNIISLKTILVLFYRPPHVTFDATLQLFKILEDVSSQYSTSIILGDANLPNINWTCDPPIAFEACASLLVEFTELNNMKQIVLNPTRECNILDIILTNDPINCGKCTLLPPISTSDHNAVLCSIMSLHPRHARNEMQNIIDYNALKLEMESIDWSECFENSLDINEV